MSWLDTLASAPGGTNTGGIAQGKITIDTRSLASERAVVIREARMMGDALRQSVGGGAEAGAKQAEGALARLSNQVNGYARAWGLAFAAIAVGGIAAAQSIKALEARFRLLVGSQEEANVKLEQLRELAEKTGQPFLATVEGATALLPALRNSNASLTETLMLTQRLAIMDPAQGVTGAAFAIREFLNGEYLSLVRRLELDRKRLRQIRDESDGDAAKMIQGLSDYVDELGVTNDALYAMGETGVNAFAVMRDEARQTMGLVFEPFLNDILIPITRTLGDMMRQLRDLSPEMQKFVGITAGLGATAGLAQRGLPFIGAIPGGGAIARAGVGAAALYGGSQLGVYAARTAGIGELGGMSQQEANNQITERIKQVIFILASGLAEVAKLAVSWWFAIRDPLDTAIGFFVTQVTLAANAVKWLIDQIPGRSTWDKIENARMFPMMAGSALAGLGAQGLARMGVPWAQARQSGGGAAGGEAGGGNFWSDFTRQATGVFSSIRSGADAMEESAEDAKTEAELASEAIDKMLLEFGQMIGVIDEAPDVLKMATNTLGLFINRLQLLREATIAKLTERDVAITDELLEEWTAFQEKLSEVEAEAQRDRIEETEQYNRRRAEIMQDYVERAADLQEEQNEQYLRALSRLRDRENDVRTQLAETILEADEELYENTQELRDDYHKSEEDAAEEHARRLQQIQRDSRAEMLDAAAHLDAERIWQIQNSAARQTQEEKSSYSEERDRRAEALREALDQEVQSHSERVQVAREAAAERITELRAAFQKEQAERASEFEQRMAALREQNGRQLTELANQHLARLNQITLDADAESRALEDEFISVFDAIQTAAGKHESVMLGIHQAGQQQIEQQLLAWYEGMKTKMQPAPTMGPAPAPSGYGGPLSSAFDSGLMGRYIAVGDTGMSVKQTGAYLLKRGEEVLHDSAASIWRRAMGQSVSQTALMSAVTQFANGGQSAPQYAFASGAVQIAVNGAGDPEETARAVRQELMRVFS